MFRMPDDNINCRHSESTDDVVYCLVAVIALDALLLVCVCVCVRVLSESLSPFYRYLSGDHFPISMSRVLVFLNFCCVFISQSGLVQSLDAECVAYGATGCIAFTMLHLVCTDILFNIIWVMLDGAWIADIRSCFF